MKIDTVSRLHFGLIDLNGGIGRVDGGVGLALSHPNIRVRAELSNKISAEGPLSDRAEKAAYSVIQHIDGKPIRIEITRKYPQHIGLGSGTQIALASGLAACLLNNKTLQPQKIADITGRGGTSGIGTAAFHQGGFILDGGHGINEKNGFLPSSESKASPPPTISRQKFPDWEIRLLIPEKEGAYGSRELDIFQKECPIPNREVEKVCRIILMKLLPSVRRESFSEFKEAITRLQDIGFKSREIKYQPKSKQILQDLKNKEVAAGMSSLGPTIYVIHPEKIDIPNYNVRTIDTKANNKGAEVSDS